MNICFIQPPSSLLLEDKVMPPLGILYLAAWLQRFDHDVSVIDLAGVDDWLVHISKHRQLIAEADWIGITATTPQYALAKTIASEVRLHNQTAPCIIGGIHITSLNHANEIGFLKTDGFDSYVIGEGYNAVTKICSDIDRKGRAQLLYTEPILDNVNRLPFAARDLIDIKSYKYKLGDTPATTFYSQYGCPYACQYCESPMAGSYTVRAMTPVRIREEILDIHYRFGIDGIMFFDDEMNLDQKRMLGICEQLEWLRRNQIKKLVWRGFVVTAKWNEELAMACKSSGCYEIASGIESGSPEILRAIKKPARVDINKRFIITSKKCGLRVKAFLIVGLPSESWSTIRETDKFLYGLHQEGYGPDDIDVSILQVYPGAPIYLKPQDVEFSKDWDKAWYKSAPGSYESLVQIKTAAMGPKDLIAARNYLEHKYKPGKWIEDMTGRKDADRIYESMDVADSIRYAEKMLAG